MGVRLGGVLAALHSQTRTEAKVIVREYSFVQPNAEDIRPGDIRRLPPLMDVEVQSAAVSP